MTLLKNAKGHAVEGSVVRGFSQIEGVDFRVWDEAF
jgi:hypothetical protein